MEQRYDTDIVDLNVGGVHYTTTRATLTAHAPHMLSLMLESKLPVRTDSAGRFLIDRDGETFRYVLQYLRTGSLPELDPKVTRGQLRAEADFFRIESLLGLLHASESRIVNIAIPDVVGTLEIVNTLTETVTYWCYGAESRLRELCDGKISQSKCLRWEPITLHFMRLKDGDIFHRGRYYVSSDHLLSFIEGFACFNEIVDFNNDISNGISKSFRGDNHGITLRVTSEDGSLVKVEGEESAVAFVETILALFLWFFTSRTRRYQLINTGENVKVVSLSLKPGVNFMEKVSSSRLDMSSRVPDRSKWLVLALDYVKEVLRENTSWQSGDIECEDDEQLRYPLEWEVVCT